MKFEVVRQSDNQIMMNTESTSCIPYEYLNSMSTDGYYFRIDGKKVTISAIKSLNESVDISVKTSENAECVKTVSKSVRCLDTGEVFKNQAEAARYFNIDPAQVSDSIKTGKPRSGHTFEKVVS